MKKENTKQKLFENMIKLNPELKNNTYLNEGVLNEVDDMQTFLSDLGFGDMYYQYKNNPQQLERIFNKILFGRNLNKFKKLLHPEEIPQPEVPVEPEKQQPTIEAFVQALPDDFHQKMQKMVNTYGDDVIENMIQEVLEKIGGEIGITNDKEANVFLDYIWANKEQFIILMDKRFSENSSGEDVIQEDRENFKRLVAFLIYDKDGNYLGELEPMNYEETYINNFDDVFALPEFQKFAQEKGITAKQVGQIKRENTFTMNDKLLSQKYYTPSSSQELYDSENDIWYTTNGQQLRDPSEYDRGGDGYTPFGDEDY